MIEFVLTSTLAYEALANKKFKPRVRKEINNLVKRIFTGFGLIPLSLRVKSIILFIVFNQVDNFIIQGTLFSKLISGTNSTFIAESKFSLLNGGPP